MRISLVAVAGISSVIAVPLITLPLIGEDSKPITLDAVTDDGARDLCVNEHGTPLLATGLDCNVLEPLSIELRKRNLLLSGVLTGDNGMVDVLSSDNKPEPALINIESGLRRRNLLLSGILDDDNTIVDVLSSDNKPEPALIDIESAMARRQVSAVKSPVAAVSAGLKRQLNTNVAIPPIRADRLRRQQLNVLGTTVSLLGGNSNPNAEHANQAEVNVNSASDRSVGTPSTESTIYLASEEAQRKPQSQPEVESEGVAELSLDQEDDFADLEMETENTDTDVEVFPQEHPMEPAADETGLTVDVYRKL